MSKDLRQQFDSYFEGTEVPEGLAEDAKKYVKQRSHTRRGWLKPLCAAACALLVCSVAGISYFVDNISSSTGGDPSGDDTVVGGDSSNLPNDENDETFDRYTLASLTANAADPYTASAANGKLKLVENFAYASNCSVNQFLLYQSGEGDTLLASADVSLKGGFFRYDFTMYLELTNAYCDELQSYTAGEESYYQGLSYRYSVELENGEYRTDVYTSDDGVKYYFTLTTSDSEGYRALLSLIANNR